MQTLRREAEQGDPSARVRLLAERLRRAPACESMAHWQLPAKSCETCAGTGSPFRARLELGAYCGSDEAGEALGGGRWWLGLTGMLPPLQSEAFSDPASLGLETLVRGLSRWGPPAERRAARAAQQLATDEDERWKDGPPMAPHSWGENGCTRCGARLLYSSRARGDGLCGPCARVTSSRAGLKVAAEWEACPCEAHDRALKDLVVAASEIHYHHAVLLHANGQPALVPEAIQAAARLAGEQPVRDAIRTALTAWALRD